MNLFTRLLSRDTKKQFLNFNPTDSHWRVVSWNYDLPTTEQRRWAVEIVKDVEEDIFFDRSKIDEIQFLHNKKVTHLKKVKSKDDVALMNLAIHSTLKYSLEFNYEFMLTPVTGAIARDFQNEARSLQWIQASFGTIDRALDKLQKDKDLILTGVFFSGITPDTQERVLRLIIFNLDIFFYMRSDNSLQIAVFDDKSQGHGTSKTPTFQQIIKVTKPQFYDEIVKLVQHVADVGEVI